MSRYYFIGDIHGCADELEELIEKLSIGPNDHLYSVGDLVNKGPKSNEAVELLIKHNAKAVIGNHDLLVKYIHLEKTQQQAAPIELKAKHYDLYDSLSNASIDYIVNLPLFIRIDEIETMVIHAGLNPNLAIDQQLESEITSIRIVDPVSKTYVKRDQPGNPWYYYYKGGDRIIYGHSASKSIKINKNTIGIDTGCLYGEKLTAYILPDNRFISVKAKHHYNDYSQNGKYTMPR